MSDYVPIMSNRQLQQPLLITSHNNMGASHLSSTEAATAIGGVTMSSSSAGNMLLSSHATTSTNGSGGGCGALEASDESLTLGSISPAAAAGGGVDLRRQLCDQNLFVFHLPSQWTEEELRREFSKFGSILSVKVVKRPDGSSKGYGFVCYTDGLSACTAVEQMNGRSFDGKKLKVSLKKTPEECLHMQVQKLMEMSNESQPFNSDRDCTLFVFHLPSNWDDKDIHKQFESFGSLQSAKVAKRSDNQSRGYGFVTYESPRAAALAIANMNGVDVGDNKRLKVQLKQQSSVQQPAPGCTVFVFHLPSDWTDIHLRQHFSHIGKIIGASVQRDGRGNARGFGFIRFDKPQSAQNAVIGMNGFSVGHKRLKVSLKKGDTSDLSSQGSQLLSFAPQQKGMNFWDAATVVAAEFAAYSAASQQQNPSPFMTQHQVGNQIQQHQIGGGNNGAFSMRGVYDRDPMISNVPAGCSYPAGMDMGNGRNNNNNNNSGSSSHNNFSGNNVNNNIYASYHQDPQTSWR